MQVEINAEVWLVTDDKTSVYGDILGATISINESEVELKDVLHRLSLALQAVGFEQGIFVSRDEPSDGLPDAMKRLELRLKDDV